MSSRRNLPAKLSLAFEATGVFLRHALVEPLRSVPSLPRAMHYLSTHRCNARCVMCGIWKESDTAGEDLRPVELARILNDRLFSHMEYVGVSGGEPFLREDLSLLFEAFLKHCRRLKRLSLTTNGLIPSRMEANLGELAELVRSAGVLFDVSVSVHGIGATLERIYGVPRAFEKMERGVGLLQDLRDRGLLTFSFNCVLLADNLDGIRDLTAWAGERGIPVNFVVGEQRDRFRTGGLEDAFVGQELRGELVAFLRSVADDPAQSTPAAVKYRELAAVLDGRRTRRLSCYYAMGGLLLGHDGTLYYCPHSAAIGSCRDRSPREVYYDAGNLRYRSRELKHKKCPVCPPYTRTRWEIEKDLPRMLAAAVLRKLRPRRSPPDR